MSMTTVMLVFVGMTLAFLDEGYQGDWMMRNTLRIGRLKVR